ncbi:cyclic beta-1,2-glucan synthetase [Polaromonas sp. OV174]|nr:cyclic beta-1,2-glucan synthetase [Polaromonas sp. OV174]
MTNRAPMLVATRTSLPPEGTVLAWGGPARRTLAPMLVASRTALPPRGRISPWGGPAAKPLF